MEDSVLNCEIPNNRLYTFEGNINLRGFPRLLSIDNNNILLRGSVLKNTKWMIGLAVYVGGDTKLMKN